MDIGDTLDGINAGIYLARGKITDAFLSAISVIPAMGSAIAQPIKTILNVADTSGDAVKSVTKLINKFGDVGKVLDKIKDFSKTIFNFIKGKLDDLVRVCKNNRFLRKIADKVSSVTHVLTGALDKLKGVADNVIAKVKKVFSKNSDEFVEAIESKIGNGYDISYIGSVSYKEN